MPRWNAVTNTATGDACIQNVCTSITIMQCFSYAIRSQSVLTLGRVYNVQYRPCILNKSEIASIACLHNLSGPALLSCSNLSASRQSTVALEKSRSPATVNKYANHAITQERSFVYKFHMFKSEIISCSTCIASFRAHCSACAAKIQTDRQTE